MFCSALFCCATNCFKLLCCLLYCCVSEHKKLWTLLLLKALSYFTSHLFALSCFSALWLMYYACFCIFAMAHMHPVWNCLLRHLCVRFLLLNFLRSGLISYSFKKVFARLPGISFPNFGGTVITCVFWRLLSDCQEKWRDTLSSRDFWTSRPYVKLDVSWDNFIPYALILRSKWWLGTLHLMASLSHSSMYASAVDQDVNLTRSIWFDQIYTVHFETQHFSFQKSWGLRWYCRFLTCMGSGAESSPWIQNFEYSIFFIFIFRTWKVSTDFSWRALHSDYRQNSNSSGISGQRFKMPL